MSKKFTGKYYILLNLNNGYLENDVVAFKVEVNQEITLGRYLLKIYRGETVLTEDDYIWWSVSSYQKNLFLGKEYYEKYGLFPIEKNEFLSLINNSVKEVNKKEFVKLMLKNGKNI